MNKKLMMLVTALAVAFGARAETETVGGYTWTYHINGDTAEIYNDGSISQAKIAEELGISRRTVLRNIAAMPDIVRRVGPDKGGHWELSEVNNEGVHP